MQGLEVESKQMFWKEMQSQWWGPLFDRTYLQRDEAHSTQIPSLDGSCKGTQRLKRPAENCAQ